METPWTPNEELVASRIADLRATADRVRFARQPRKSGGWLNSIRRRSSTMAAGAPTTTGCVPSTTAA